MTRPPYTVTLADLCEHQACEDKYEAWARFLRYDTSPQPLARMFDCPDLGVSEVYWATRCLPAEERKALFALTLPLLVERAKAYTNNRAANWAANWAAYRAAYRAANWAANWAAGAAEAAAWAAAEAATFAANAANAAVHAANAPRSAERAHQARDLREALAKLTTPNT